MEVIRQTEPHNPHDFSLILTNVVGHYQYKIIKGLFDKVVQTHIFSF